MSDACDAHPHLTFADVTAPGSCAGQSTITRTWTATDACGNASTAILFNNAVTPTAPVFAPLPAPSTIECPATPSFATPSVTDASDPNPRLSFEDRTAAGSCPGQYSVTRNWTAVDACRNTSTASQAITVRDQPAPVVSCPTDITVGACQNPVSF